MKNEHDQILLEAYMWGFNDELDGNTRMWDPSPLLLKAYNLGRQDAEHGDDVRSVDAQTEQQILHRILHQSAD